MAFEKPLLSTLRAAALAVWRTIRPSADDGPGSDVDVEVSTLTHLVDSLHTHIAAVQKLLFISTAWDVALDAWMEALGCPNGLGGYGRYQPTPSSGTDALQVTATGAGQVTVGDQLTDTGGRLYQAAETYVFAGAGTHDIDVDAISTGAATNLETGAVLTFVTPPANIQDTATLVKDLDGGRDRETDAEGRRRGLSYLRAPNMSGNWPEWKRYVEAALPGMVTAYVWPSRPNSPYGWGCTDVTALQIGESGDDREITTAQKATIQAYLDDETPSRMHRLLRILDVSVEKHVIVIAYTLADGTPASYEVDWDAEANKRTCAAGTAELTKLIVANAVYGADIIEAGDKVLIAGLEAVIALEPGNAGAPVGGLMDRFTVETWPWEVNLLTGGAAAGPFSILSGGGLAKVVFDAEKAHIDALGPSRGPYAAPIGSWLDALRIDLIKSAASMAIAAQGVGVTGFPTCTIDGGGNDIEPTVDNTDTVVLKSFSEIDVYQEL